MAVTKLMNIKSSPHAAGRHLYNSIRYIINPKKTKDGLLVAGNAGNEACEIYDVMMDTKREWEKTDGRQGYHFVLSWKAGEVNADQAFEMIKEFCEEYLGDRYDYVYSVHDDHDHMHGHIVFNSVSRSTGYKYRYEKGDWEKYIQPITDKICERHGLSKLEYEREAKVGKSYAEHYAEKEGRYTWKKIIQADIDFVVSCSRSWEDFLTQMREIGYTFPRAGVKSETGEYITFCAPGGHRRRSDSLGVGYSVNDIRDRIKGNFLSEGRKKYHGIASPKLRRYRMKSWQKIIPISPYQKKYVRRHFRASTFSRTNPYAVDQARIRRDLLQLERLGQDCRYLLRYHIVSEEALEQRSLELKKEEKYLRNQKTMESLLEDDPAVTEYEQLLKQLQSMQDLSDDGFEGIQDRMDELEKRMPEGTPAMLTRYLHASDRLGQIREEKKVIRHIKKISEKELKSEKIISKEASVNSYQRKEKGKRGEKQWKQR